MTIVGIDWATCKHDICLMQADGRELNRFTVTHDAQGLEHLAATIAGHEPDSNQVRVAIEMHDGALLAFLLDQGYTVYGINPKSAERARDRYRPAGGKDDSSDSFILADMLRTDRGTLRPVRPQSEATQDLRFLLQLRGARVHERTQLSNRLRARLIDWCPELSRLCDDFNRIWQRRLLECFPLQADLHAAHGNTLNAFVREHHLAPVTADRIHAARVADPMPIPEGRVAALRMDIEMLVEQIDLLCRAIADLDKQIEQKTEAHPDAQLFRSLPIKGRISVASMLAGFGEDRENSPGHRRIAAAWGVAPVTIQTGKSRWVQRRFAADHTMTQALMDFAFNTAFTDGCWAADFYQRKRAEGKRHYTALRCLAQRWVKILHAMWRDRQPYDEQKHRRSRQRQTDGAQVAAA